MKATGKATATGKAGGSKVGKFGIGVRVVDDEGDVGVIVGKRKGERLVNYDVLGEIWWPKGLLAVAANDNATTDTPSISPEIVVNDYSGAADGENSSEWVPKVGDRVRFKIDSGPTRPKGSEGVVDELFSSTIARVLFDGPFEGWGDTGRHWHLHNSDIEPLPVAEQPAAEVTPAPLTIEAGKSYRTRDGRKAEGAGPSGRGDQYPVQATVNGETYQFTSDGFLFDGCETALDLVAEWVEPAAEDLEAAEAEVKALLSDSTTPAKFKVGDRVQPTNERYGWITSQWDAYWKAAEGPAPRGEFFIASDLFEFGHMISNRPSGNGPHWPADYLELVTSTSASSPSTFARNDLVTLAAPVKVTGTSGDRVHISFSNGGSFTLPASALIAA